MDCVCGKPACAVATRDGRVAFTCPQGRCRFYAVAPTQCDGYRRIGWTLTTPEDAIIIRCEAMQPPGEAPNTMGVMMRCQGVLDGRAEVRAVLEDDRFHPRWHRVHAAYVYHMAHYATLLEELRRLPRVWVEEIPNFFFDVLRRNAALDDHDENNDDDTALLDGEDVVMMQLKPFQRRGVSFVLRHGGRAMIADDMGLGKTIQAIAVAHHYRHEWPMLVLCPMSLMENWAKEINRFCGLPFSRIALLQGGGAAAAAPSALDEVVIVSYSSIKLVEKNSFSVVILDESHYIKAADTKRSQQALRLCKAARRVVLLSGTPAMSRPIELYTQMQAMRPNMVPSRAQFAARYCNAFVSRYGVDMSGHSHMDELHVLLRHFLIRRTKAELGGELPSKLRQLLYISITEKERKALERQVLALRRSIATHPDGTGGHAGGDVSSRAPNAFELKIATARAKIPAVKDYIVGVVEQYLDSGSKIIIFAHHQCMMEAIEAAVGSVRPKLPIDYIIITGDTPAAQRERLAEHFRTTPTCSVAILSMQSSGTGHNFTCATTVIFCELDWNPSTHLQCEDRVHRIGQQHPCTIKYLLADGTSDSVIWPLLQNKLSVTNAVLERRDEDGATSAAHHLHTDADRQHVVRRDVCATPTGTQGTLDGFLQSSQKVATSQSSRGSALPSSAPSSQTCGRPAQLLEADVEVGEVAPTPLNTSPQAEAAPPPPSSLLISLEERDRLGVVAGGSSVPPPRRSLQLKGRNNSNNNSTMVPPTQGQPTTSSASGPSTNVLSLLKQHASHAGTAPVAAPPTREVVVVGGAMNPPAPASSSALPRRTVFSMKAAPPTTPTTTTTLVAEVVAVVESACTSNASAEVPEPMNVVAQEEHRTYTSVSSSTATPTSAASPLTAERRTTHTVARLAIRPNVHRRSRENVDASTTVESPPRSSLRVDPLGWSGAVLGCVSPTDVAPPSLPLAPLPPSIPPPPPPSQTTHTIANNNNNSVSRSTRTVFSLKAAPLPPPPPAQPTLRPNEFCVDDNDDDVLASSSAPAEVLFSPVLVAQAAMGPQGAAPHRTRFTFSTVSSSSTTSMQ